ncbi:chemotaxis protein CheB [Giesbergeria anulus]|uniref:Two-component system, chemotaxis family, CheB/CheR fusion protein n=1 Tax=Giesbergeria anulus TaxID=180197 RepID=A0A1H9DT50_9BURK|nr:chemotaxis protein CheB [Giesbergeria anulus]SEQ16649.1 two-component system, chemotaxis family, CheB/CheR fusion protein [Giesbergeria anulus]
MRHAAYLRMVSSNTHRSSNTPAVVHSTRIVGVGASAGGLAALELFFSHVAPDSGLAYVVVQHMAPSYKAMLGTLLQRVTTLPVHEATQGLAPAPNAVYVIPPGCELTLVQGCLHLNPTRQARGPRLPINVLFQSLAQEQRQRAIGVVLSGMGADGTLGLQAIQGQDGLTLAQEPSSAQFDSMPHSAIAAGCVNIVALAQELPQRIITAIMQAAATAPSTQPQPDDAASALDTIVRLLREHSKHDLSLYKPSTLLRRIERRVAVYGLSSIADYAAFLPDNPRELDVLFAEMLIGVTSFFRDAAVWSDVQNLAWPPLLAQHPSNSPLRAWVVGCSSGEEAYSLAMTFQEAQDSLPHTAAQTLQIFATDLSAEAIAVARKGWYPAKWLAEMAPARRARFFVAQDDGGRIIKSIRDMVLFAQHDVIIDPPFTKLDFLSCRNLLIYFKAALQQRLIPLFHFSLRPGGILLLGASETVGPARRLFSPLGVKSRLYRRNDQPLSAGAVDFPVNRHAALRKTAPETLVSTSSTHPGSLQALADQVLLQTFSPPAVLVNAAGDILYISGRTGRYLEPAAGKANWNLHVMARPGIRTQLAVALRHALQEHRTVELHDLPLEDDRTRTLHLTVQAVQEPKALEGMAMVVFREVALPKRRQAKKANAANPVDTALVQELGHAREEIRALRQEMQASQEALQAANESLQSANEELQSANEELTTSKEEAQSMNEELQTINAELQTKLDDLALAQSDMQNLLNSTDIATLFLDNDLNVRRFTEQATSIFHLRDGDVGRPLSDLASALNYPALHSDVQDTLRTLASSDKQIATTDGRWFSVRIMPYRTLTNMIQGAVLTFVDITKAKELEFRLREGYSQP